MYNPSFPMATDANGGESNAWAGSGGYGGQPIMAGAKRPNHPSGNSESSGSQLGPGGASAAEKKLKTYQVGPPECREGTGHVRYRGPGHMVHPNRHFK